MNYKIIMDKPAFKFLQKQNKDQQKRILEAIQKLPNVGNIKPMEGHVNLYRLRVGDYRILYTIKNDVLIIHILDIGNRGDVYK